MISFVFGISKTVQKLIAFEAYLGEVKRSGAPAALVLAVGLLAVDRDAMPREGHALAAVPGVAPAKVVALGQTLGIDVQARKEPNQ